ncbi:MAG: hypothetical protein R3F30_06840 [Planctomycetota bacterium]
MPTLLPALLALLPLAQAPAGDPIAAALDHVRATPREQLWRAIPWRRSLTLALAEARRIGKPVFLFTYDGTLDDGNC